MSTELATREREAVPLRVSDMQVIAQQVSRSGLYGLNESQAFTLMMLAHSRGLHPVQAVERYHVIQGKPAMKADAMLAEFQAHGGVITWHKHETQVCSATFEAPAVREPVTITWTIEDAKRAELMKNTMWHKYPRQMLRARVISEGVRMTMPGIVIGIYTPEEVSDFEPLQTAQEPRQDVPASEPARKPAPSRERPREAAAASRKGKDERTCWEVIEAGIASYQQKLADELSTPEAARSLTLTTHQVQRHLVEHRLGRATDGLGNREVSKTLEQLYDDRAHRRAVQAELKSYLEAAYLDARKNYAGEVLDAVGEDAEAAGDPGDEGDPDVDYPDEPGSDG